MRTTIAGFASTLLFQVGGFAQSVSSAPGSMKGEEFVRATNGEPAILVHARVVLNEPVTREARSDTQGAFAIDKLPVAIYRIDATAPGLYGALEQ